MKPSLEITGTSSRTLNPSLNSDKKWQKAVSFQPNAIAKPSLDPRAKEAQVRDVVAKAVAQYWPLYQTKFPEAFNDKHGNIRKSLPEVVYLYTWSEMTKFKVKVGTLAFVQANNPNTVYVYMPSAIKVIKQYGSKSISAAIAHELIHCATSSALCIMNQQFYDKNSFAGDVLRKTIVLPAWGHDGHKQSFTVQELLCEGAADVLSCSVTGLSRDDCKYYQTYRDLTKELISMSGIGYETYKKALTGLKFDTYDANYEAYRKVIAAAEKLADKHNKSYRDTVQSNPLFNWYDQNNREKIK